MQIEALIERMEGLSGPDREVDALAMQAAFPEWAKIGAPYLSPQCIGDEPIYWHAPQNSPYQKMPVPELTASLDAAIALVGRVLPGWSWEARQSGTGDQGQATVWNPLRIPSDNQQQRAYNCASPQIALLIAMFRALAAGGSDA